MRFAITRAANGFSGDTIHDANASRRPVDRPDAGDLMSGAGAFSTAGNAGSTRFSAVVSAAQSQGGHSFSPQAKPHPVSSRMVTPGSSSGLAFSV